MIRKTVVVQRAKRVENVHAVAVERGLVHDQGPDLIERVGKVIALVLAPEVVAIASLVANNRAVAAVLVRRRLAENVRIAAVVRVHRCRTESATLAHAISHHQLAAWAFSA